MAVKPYYEVDGITIYHGDCREILPGHFWTDVVVTDPPYGDTSLDWDVPVRGWTDKLDPPQLWCFGSMRLFMQHGAEFDSGGWRYAQEIVWEKHNGSSFHADRFKRVHEFAVHFYRGEWGALYRHVPTTPDATARQVIRRRRPPHMGHIEASAYESETGGPRLMRSVLQARSCHGYADHPTQKPVEILRPLIQFSCPPRGTVMDPFMGSGSTLLAARSLGRRAIGIEIEERYCEIAAKRLAQGVLALAEAR
jgi:site-specific DNA-methyltransferase (adenine-specific)